MYPTDRKYTKDHEWVELGTDRPKVGVTSFAQEQLGDVVFVELPKVGDEVKAGNAFAVVESVKAVSDVYAPVSGTVVQVNEKLGESPELINQDPHGEGWIAVIQMTAPAEVDNLLSAEEYERLAREEGEH